MPLAPSLLWPAGSPPGPVTLTLRAPRVVGSLGIARPRTLCARPSPTQPPQGPPTDLVNVVSGPPTGAFWTSGRLPCLPLSSPPARLVSACCYGHVRRTQVKALALTHRWQETTFAHVSQTCPVSKSRADTDTDVARHGALGRRTLSPGFLLTGAGRALWPSPGLRVCAGRSLGLSVRCELSHVCRADVPASVLSAPTRPAVDLGPRHAPWGP